MIWIEKCEINVTRTCNNRCACCNHGSPVAAPYFMEPEVLRRDLEYLKPFLRIGFLCLQGGEPLIHPRILDLMAIQGESGIADKYGMLSNGKLLSRQGDDFYRKAGQLKYELRVSVYPDLDMREIQSCIEKSVRHGFEIRPGPTPTFWTLFKEQPDNGRKVWDNCYAKTCYTIHEGFFYHCPLAAFFPSQFFNQPPNMDGLPLNGVTEEQFRQFLARTEPLWMCAHCTGGQSKWIPWHQTPNLEMWKSEATE